MTSNYFKFLLGTRTRLKEIRLKEIRVEEKNFIKKIGKV